MSQPKFMHEIEKKKNLINQSTVIDMGFTQSMIKKLLPEPVLKPNPRYKSSAPMKLWEEETVLAIMETQEYELLWEKSQKRSKRAIEICEKKADKLCEEVEEVAQKIQIKMLEKDVLLKYVFIERADWYFEHDNNGLNDHDQIMANLYATKDETIERWVVNFIRHNLVDIKYGGYDEILRRLKGQIGINNAYYLLKRKVLEKIAEAYPEYAAECHRQIKSIHF